MGFIVFILLFVVNIFGAFSIPTLPTTTPMISSTTTKHPSYSAHLVSSTQCNYCGSYNVINPGTPDYERFIGIKSCQLKTVFSDQIKYKKFRSLQKHAFRYEMTQLCAMDSEPDLSASVPTTTSRIPVHYSEFSDSGHGSFVYGFNPRRQINSGQYCIVHSEDLQYLNNLIFTWASSLQLAPPVLPPFLLQDPSHNLAKPLSINDGFVPYRGTFQNEEVTSVSNVAHYVPVVGGFVPYPDIYSAAVSYTTSVEPVVSTTSKDELRRKRDDSQFSSKDFGYSEDIPIVVACLCY